jgi:hypothetical protein
MTTQLEEIVADAVAQERARVVEFLREADIECGEARVLARVASLIEHGEHRREEGA